MTRLAIAVAISALGVLAGVYSLHVARDDPAYWFAGGSRSGDLALLAAGWTLIGAGLAVWLRRRAGRCGLLLVAAGFAWFVPEWSNPGIGSRLAFTAGLTLAAACTAFVGHAVLAYPGGRLASRLERSAVAAAYLGAVVVLGLLPALVFDPEPACSECPRNLLLVSNDGGAAEWLDRIGIYLGVAWTAALTVLVAARIGRTATRTVLVPGAVYLALVTALFASSLGRDAIAVATLERRLWLGQAVALVALAAAVAWDVARARRARAAMARLVVELVQSRPAGDLGASLGRIVGDPDLVLAYPLDDPERLVDATGRPVTLSSAQERTTLVRDGHAVAVLAHAPGMLADEQLVDEVAAAARLALENERLQAEVNARLEELRASRARIVAAGDGERRRLERDLHDGAQQRLVAVSLSLQLLHSRWAADGNAPALARLEQAERELSLAIGELRELAHGIFPAVLADEGLAAAVEALAEESAVPIRSGGLPDERFPPPVETAAYTVVAELARTAAGGLTVQAARDNGVLRLEVVAPDAASGLDLVALEDRVGAIGGRLAALRDGDGRITIRAELPCES
jgi:signal transduction histidine kinase